YETGIGKLIDTLAKCWEQDRKSGKVQVNIAEYEFNKRRCIRIETTHTERNAQCYCYRGIAYLDAQYFLPVRAECYDWPRAGGRRFAGSVQLRGRAVQPQPVGIGVRKVSGITPTGKIVTQV